MAPVRAAVVTWLQIGVVRIWLVEPPLSATSTPSVTKTPLPTVTSRLTIRSTVTPLISQLDFYGEITLVEAQSQVDFPIYLPTLPVGLGPPDHVYLQKAEGDVIILVWMRPDQPNKVRMSFHLLGPGAFAWKMQPPSLAEVMVNGAEAFWTQGPYYIQTKSAGGGTWGNRRLVDSYVLIWADGEMTYRLESDLSLEEAVRVAETIALPTTLPKE
jgi:hypothetical protein